MEGRKLAGYRAGSDGVPPCGKKNIVTGDNIFPGVVKKLRHKIVGRWKGLPDAGRFLDSYRGLAERLADYVALSNEYSCGMFLALLECAGWVVLPPVTWRGVASFMSDLMLTDAEKERLQMLRDRLVTELLPMVKKVEAISQELLQIMTVAKERKKRILN